MEMSLLFIDDATINQVLMKNIFQDYFSLTFVKSCNEAIPYIDDYNNHYDVIILDLVMHGAIDLLRYIKRHDYTKRIPVIVIAASDQENDLIEAFDVGAYDFITKPFQSELIFNRVCHAGQYYHRYKQLVEQREEIDEASLDSLTQVFNLDTTKWLIDEKNSIYPHDKKALLVFRINHLEDIYLHEGQHHGDNVMKNITEFITGHFRSIDIVGRIDNNTIVVYVSHLHSIDSAKSKISEIYRLFTQKLIAEIPEDITLSIGMAYDHQQTTFDALYKKALETIKQQEEA